MLVRQVAIGSEPTIECYPSDGVPDAAPTVTAYDSDGVALWSVAGSLDSASATAAGSERGDEITLSASAPAVPPVLSVGRTYWVATSGGKGQAVTVSDALGSNKYEIEPRLRSAVVTGTLKGLRMSLTLTAVQTAAELLGVSLVFSWETGGVERRREVGIDVVARPVDLEITEADLRAEDPEYSEQAGRHETTWRRQIEGAREDVQAQLVAYRIRPEDLDARQRGVLRATVVARALFRRYISVVESRITWDLRYQERLRALVTSVCHDHVEGEDDYEGWGVV